MSTAEATSPGRVGENRKKLQEKCLKIVSPVSPAWLYCCYAVIIVLTGAVIALSVALSLSAGKTEQISRNKTYAVCPRNWIGFGNKCFNFSEDMENWPFSQNYCRALGAQLARFDNQEELNFLKRYKGPFDHWISLHRESSHHPWMWADNTEYNNLYVLRMLFLLLCSSVVTV
ncbi:C-type lectin domain family 2 member G-like isoform X3 [Microtus oregoni]|uniref:C-type lectin domain family 2 member G-like isoform X3 n=1 Tax=Microtus oregoni TaxID=111838 RepID=UPI001BB14564|nr:C-type lectin domain family 2 member G-like isoform X3 [Microtus oregoni]